MAIVIFTALNGMGVTFLLYVLAQFWKEGHRLRKGARRRFAAEFSEENKPQIFVVTHPISHSAYGGLSIVPMKACENNQDGDRFGEDSADAADGMSRKRFTAS